MVQQKNNDDHTSNISIPSFFRCPISLDLMQSPVVLPTGVTYDRSSIQRWLDDGHTTCPATMLPLSSPHLLPNLALQNLIQIWSLSVQRQKRHRFVSSQNDVVQAIQHLKRNDIPRVSSLAEILSFAESESEENLEFLVNCEGFVDLLVDFLGNVDFGVEFLEKVVKILELVLCKVKRDEQKSKLKRTIANCCLASLILVLQQVSSENSKLATVNILKFACTDIESKTLIAENEDLIRELFNTLKTTTFGKDEKLIENCLLCLVEISTSRRNKAKLINLGGVRVLSELLTGSKRSVLVIENVLKLLEAMSTMKEGRVKICEDLNCVGLILSKVMKVSNVATEYGVTILWSLCYLFRDQRAQELVTKGNGLTKILLLMQMNCEAGVRRMCVDLLKIFRVNSKSCLSCYHTKTTHIMPF